MARGFRFGGKPRAMPAAAQRRAKFGNKRVEHNGEWFDSKRELAIWLQYEMLAKAGQITHLERQPVYRIVINGVKIGKYIPDLQFRELAGRLRVLDVKSPATAAERLFRWKKKITEALYPGVTIEIVF
jgi:hypothetical protein